MALSEEHINDRLDRLAGDIRDETAGRREDRSELRSELWAQGSELRKQIWDEIGEVRKTTQKEIDGLWKILLAIAVALMVAVSIAVDDANAAPLMNPPSAHHWAPISAAPISVRADQRLDLA